MKTNALARSEEFHFAVDQRRMIRDMYLNGATDTEAEVLIAICEARRLNPMLGQVHPVKRWNADKGREVWALQIAIDGMRAKAEETGLYDGQDEPEIERDERGRIVAAKVKVYKRGIGRPFVGVARYAEFVQTKRDGSPTHMWAKMPEHMTCKCAEAGAFRKAFPEELSGLYAPEEHQRAPKHVAYDAEPGEAANDNGDVVGAFSARIAAAATPKALKAVGQEIAKVELSAAEHLTLEAIYTARLAFLKKPHEAELTLEPTEG